MSRGLRGTRRRKSRSGRPIWPSLVLMLASVSLLGAVGVFAYLTAPRRTDPISHCWIDAPPEAHTLVILDISENPKGPLRGHIQAAIADARNNLASGDKLTVVVLNPTDPYAPKEVVSVCNPGNPTRVNRLYASTWRAEKAWNETLGEALDAKIAQLGRRSSASSGRASPLLEAIAASSWRADFGDPGPLSPGAQPPALRRRLILVSDMLQSSRLWTHYRAGSTDWASFDKTSAARRAGAALQGVDVTIEYLVRPESAEWQTPELLDFWRQYFTASGAARLTFRGVPPDVVAPISPPAG